MLLDISHISQLIESSDIKLFRADYKLTHCREIVDEAKRFHVEEKNVMIRRKDVSAALKYVN